MRRVLVLGAETPAGQAIVGALAERGDRVAAVAASAGPEAAFAVQRLVRRAGAALSQAVDATNEMAVRVMVRQVSKDLGGLDALFFCADLGGETAGAVALAARFAGREMARGGGGVIAVLGGAEVGETPEGVRVVRLEATPEPDEAWAREAVGRVLGVGP